MTIEQVRYMLAVADHHNFSHAAEALFLSQSALSMQIAKLEKEVGFPLFRRTPRGVFLTEEGEVFYRYAKPVAEDWKTLQSKMEERKNTPAGNLRIGLGPRVFSNHLFEPLMEFFEKRTEIHASFVSTFGKDAISDLERGRLDVLLDWLPPDEQLSDPGAIASWALIQERCCILTAADDPFGELEACSPQQALEHKPMITGLEHSISDRNLAQIIKNTGVPAAEPYRVDDTNTIVSLVQNGHGIMIGPPSIAGYYHLSAVPIVPESYNALCFICLSAQQDDPRIKLLRSYVLSLCAGRNAK